MFLMLFLYKTGARIQEALNVKLLDIQFGKSPNVMLIGKPNNKVRTVPLREDTVTHLKGYINMFHSGEGIYSDTHLFYTVRSGEKKRMTEDNARAEHINAERYKVDEEDVIKELCGLK